MGRPDLVTLADRYALEAEIARGGMATVWRALDTVLAREVAVKMLYPSLSEDPSFVDRFRREALAAARLTHPNVVSIYDTGEQAGDDGRPRHFIVMEYCSRGDLFGVIRREGALDPGRVAGIGLDILAALAYAHRQNVVHRDVKPANVLISSDGTLKVTDFGIAKAAYEQSGNDVTTTGKILGTVTYISPEQAKGVEPDARSDIYSVGALLFELLTGRPPFTEENPVATAMAHVHKPPPRPRSLRAGIPRSIESVVLRALEKDPGDRFQTADDMRRALEHHATDEQTAVFSAPVPAAPRRPEAVEEDSTTAVEALPGPPDVLAPGRMRWVVAACVIAALAAALVFGVPALRNLGQPVNPGPPAGTGNESPAAPHPIQVAAVSDFDPDGDGQEHPEEAAAAADGNPATAWETEDYQSSLASQGKRGVGLIFDLGRARAVTEVRLQSPTPGYTFELREGNSQAPDPQGYRLLDRGTGRPTMSLQVAGVQARYWLVWITELPGGQGRAALSEVTFFGR
jgi:serine/threonine-protein kinase